MAELLEKGGTQAEKDLLAEFSQRFAEFQRIDDELLKLAVQNTNLKAYALAFGPAAGALDEMSAALSRLVTANADARNAKQVMSLALGAEIAALRIQSLLPPHIAEAGDARMDELEAQMTREDDQVRSDLDDLGRDPEARRWCRPRNRRVALRPVPRAPDPDPRALAREHQSFDRCRSR